MLGLKLPTDPRWVDLVESDLAEILTDHAYCEQKAASTAISLIVSYPELPELVSAMAALAQEEMEHFERVHRLLRKHGYNLGRERKDSYVNDLQSFVRRGQGRITTLTDRLCLAALIEARSCERFKLLSEHLTDVSLRAFYRELMVSEAGHYATFLKLARQFGHDAETRWQQWLAFEAEVIGRYSVAPTMHG